MAANKKVFTTRAKDENGVEVDVELMVRWPSAKVRQDASLYRAATYRKALDAGALMRQRLDDYLRRQNLWDDEKDEEYGKLRKAVLDAEYALAKGGIKKSEARKIALDMGRKRAEMQAMRAAVTSVDSNTADAIADEAQFNYLVAHCTVYSSGRREGKPFFTGDGEHASVDVYIEQGSEKAAIDAATNLNTLIYGSVEELLKKLPENAFLIKYGFMDEKLRLINAKGQFVDTEGRLVDEEGRWINEDNVLVDSEGRPVGEDGNYVTEFAEFLED